jgi:predicted amidohydrolase YtcJ
VTRTRAGAASGSDGWIPKQRITVKEAVAGFTIGAAIASGREHYMGRIKEGYLADLTILDRDIFEIDPQEIPSAGIAATIVDGQVIYQGW